MKDESKLCKSQRNRRAIITIITYQFEFALDACVKRRLRRTNQTNEHLIRSKRQQVYTVSKQCAYRHDRVATCIERHFDRHFDDAKQIKEFVFGHTNQSKRFVDLDDLPAASMKFAVAIGPNAFFAMKKRNTDWFVFHVLHPIFGRPVSLFVCRYLLLLTGIFEQEKTDKPCIRSKLKNTEKSSVFTNPIWGFFFVLWCDNVITTFVDFEKTRKVIRCQKKKTKKKNTSANSIAPDSQRVDIADWLATFCCSCNHLHASDRRSLIIDKQTP